ncbi:hypothetical protein [Flavobacterium nitratireducens]|uniref:hypothetical protein n=1 Tax=Flavobacterium nitratireducens TaxID=992289 RepID=UPI0024158843|nr:hypothetical protein [Flavobacterium nitratireducens]
MKNFFFLLLIIPVIGFSQESKLSTPSLFIEKSSYVQINMDENEKAIFKSGLGESVEFYPSEIIDLKSNNKLNGLAIESTYVIGSRGMATISAKETAWVGMDEISDLIVWFEKYVIPNLDAAAGKNKTVKYIFNSKEVMLKFEIYNGTQIFSVIINNTLYKDKYFWTEAKVKDIPNVLKSLKYLQTKS